MSDEDFQIDKSSEEIKSEENNNTGAEASEEGKVIDEAQYRIHAPRQKGPTAIGRGGDPLYKRINASKEQLEELMEETQTVQDWIQREACNNAALKCLESENLKEAYFAIKDGFGEYGKITLMGFKTPSGIEIPRLKVYDKNGDVIQVLTGPMAIEEISKRAKEFKNGNFGYEEIPLVNNEPAESGVIQDYSGDAEHPVT